MPDLTLQEVLDRGLTQRQLNQWVDEKYLHPLARGRGRPREWPAQELEAADLMRRLLDAGLTLYAAAIAARGHLAGHPTQLAPGITLTIDNAEASR
ncbi:MerR family transcriptional regulator [Nonomuraea sp. NPDC049646]|uniref:MerR family transcriptional regulator n=1 Tax=unclassified Nonomuraea TaxID=2593643 RepID=UPI0037899985